jgi:hypothetical protein
MGLSSILSYNLSINNMHDTASLKSFKSNQQELKFLISELPVLSRIGMVYFYNIILLISWHEQNIKWTTKNGTLTFSADNKK